MQRQSSLDPRENLIRYHIELRRSEYTNLEPLNVFVGTWNVNNQPLPGSFKQWLTSESSPPDIYALGFQELIPAIEVMFLDAAASRRLEADVCRVVQANLDPRAEYFKVCTTRLVGMMIAILVRKEHVKWIKNLASDTVGTGLMGVLGNKGGVAVRFDFHDTSLCFVNCHLAAHVDECARRNQDYRDICERIIFASTPEIKCIKSHDQIYWFGDLNYRIAQMDRIAVERCLERKSLEAVLNVDQLKIEHAAKRAFASFKEGPVKFHPTYKYNPGTDNWDSSEKQRAPAWCDRILWRGEGIEQINYDSYPKLKTSDHKPVHALFVSKIKAVDAVKYQKVQREVIRKLDKHENEFLPQVCVEPIDFFFDGVKYLEPQVQKLSIVNTGQVPARFEFIKKLDEPSYCKPWLQAIPSSKRLLPGERCSVKLTVCVDEKTAFKLNSGEDELGDILVLHLRGGKDIFITVQGTYQKSCFGADFETLVQLKVPMCDHVDSLDYTRDPYPVPKEMWYLVDHLYRHGLRQAGLFRYRGILAEVWLIRDWLDLGLESDLPGSVHSIVDALLRLLQSTAEPLIPYNHHSACLRSCDSYDRCKQIVYQLPGCRKDIFLYLCSFLQEVLNHGAENGTSAKLLAMIFGGVFLREAPEESGGAGSVRDRRCKEVKKKSFVEHFLVNDLDELLEY